MAELELEHGHPYRESAGIARCPLCPRVLRPRSSKRGAAWAALRDHAKACHRNLFDCLCPSSPHTPIACPVRGCSERFHSAGKAYHHLGTCSDSSHVQAREEARACGDWQGGGNTGRRLQEHQQRILTAEELGLDHATWRLLRGLQHREITPNDYGALLELDDTIDSKVGLTKEQLARIPVAKVVDVGVAESHGKRHTLADTECAICMCEFEKGEQVSKLQCRHVFHAACASSWFKKAESCPTCRRAVEMSTLSPDGFNDGQNPSDTSKIPLSNSPMDDRPRAEDNAVPLLLCPRVCPRASSADTGAALLPTLAQGASCVGVAAAEPMHHQSCDVLVR